MNRKRTWMCVLLAGMARVGAGAQFRDPGEANAPGRKAEIPTAGLWPTPRMVEFAIDRITDEMAKVYAFDEDQLWSTRDVLKQRFPQWMDQNRGELQTLSNQYFEALLAGEPPTTEEVADWSARALPLFEQFSQLVDQTSEDMRTYMTDEQQVLLNGQLAAMQVGMSYMKQRLGTWKDGGYDWETEWPRSHEFKQQQGAREKQLQKEAERAANDAMGIPPEAGAAEGTVVVGATEAGPGAVVVREGTRHTTSQPKAGPKDEWTIYVENFIKRYQLDDAQQSTARKYLTSSQEQRDKYLQHKLADINAVDAKMKAAKTDEEREKVRTELVKLNGPLDRYFGQLKDRLDRIPTRKQRAAAADATTRGKADVPETAKTALKTEMEARARAAKAEEGEKPAPESQAKPAEPNPPAER